MSNAISFETKWTTRLERCKENEENCCERNKKFPFSLFLNTEQHPKSQVTGTLEGIMIMTKPSWHRTNVQAEPMLLCLLIKYWALASQVLRFQQGYSDISILAWFVFICNTSCVYVHIIYGPSRHWWLLVGSQLLLRLQHCFHFVWLRLGVRDVSYFDGLLWLISISICCHYPDFDFDFVPYE